MTAFAKEIVHILIFWSSNKSFSDLSGRDMTPNMHRAYTTFSRPVLDAKAFFPSLPKPLYLKVRAPT